MEIFEANIKPKNGKNISEDTHLFCESAYTHKIFCKEDKNSLEKLIKEINYSISNPSTLHYGLARLLLFLPQCSSREMTTEGDKWIRLCIDKLNSHSELTQYFLLVIKHVLRCCHDNQELMRKVLKCDLSFISMLLDVAKKNADAFDCLYEVFLLFPVQALPYKSEAEIVSLAALTLPVSEKSEERVVKAAKVFAAMPLPGKTSTGEAKGMQLGQLISLAHCAADSLFKNVIENESYDLSRLHKLPVDAISKAVVLNKPTLRLITSMNVLSNCLVYIKVFLESASGNFILFSTKDLVHLISRLLQVEVSQLEKNQTPEFQTLSFILPALHMKALQLLKNLVENDVHENYIHLIEEQVGLALKAINCRKQRIKENNETKDNLSGLTAANVPFRVICYEILTKAVKVSKTCSNFSENILPEIIADLTPIKEGCSLRRTIRGSRVNNLNARKKTKKKGYTVAMDERSEDLQMDLITQQLVTLFVPATEKALYYIEALFLYAHHSLSLVSVKMLYNCVTDCLNMRRVGLFADPKVRAGLFSAVSAYATYPHPLFPPPYSLLFDALSRGRSDPDPVVSDICSRSCSSLSFIMANPNNVNWSDIVLLNKDYETWKRSLEEERDVPLKKRKYHGNKEETEDEEGEESDSSVLNGYDGKTEETSDSEEENLSLEQTGSCSNQSEDIVIIESQREKVADKDEFRNMENGDKTENEVRLKNFKDSEVNEERSGNSFVDDVHQSESSYKHSDGTEDTTKDLPDKVYEISSEEDMSPLQIDEDQNIVNDDGDDLSELVEVEDNSPISISREKVESPVTLDNDENEITVEDMLSTLVED